MNVIPITMTETLQGHVTEYQRTVLATLDEYHQNTSPAVKISWENRKTENFTNDTIYSILDYAMAPGGMMPRNYTFTLENVEGPMNAVFPMKIVNAHTSINWFQLQESISKDALFDVVRDNINKCYQSLWYRLSYMFWSKQNEIVTGGVINADDYYPTLRPGVTILTIGDDATTMFDGVPLAARGNTATHTYGGLTITKGSDDNANWQAPVDNGTNAIDDHGTSGIGRAITPSILQNHIGKYSFGGLRPSYGSMPYNVWTNFSNIVWSMNLGQRNETAIKNAFGIENSLPFRGTEYYSEPWMMDVHYDSTSGGSIIEWGPDRFYLLLHTSTPDPVLVSEIGSNNSVQGFQQMPRSTIFFFGLFLWGNFVCQQRNLIGRINNLL